MGKCPLALNGNSVKYGTLKLSLTFVVLPCIYVYIHTYIIYIHIYSYGRNTVQTGHMPFIYTYIYSHHSINSSCFQSVRSCFTFLYNDRNMNETKRIIQCCTFYVTQFAHKGFFVRSTFCSGQTFQYSLRLK